MDGSVCQPSVVRTGGLTSVSCVFAVLDDAWQRASRLAVVPRGLHLRYLCADRSDTASTTRGISTTLLRVSGADEHRYARYGRASTTDIADISTEHMVSRCIKTAPRVIGQNVYPVAGQSGAPWYSVGVWNSSQSMPVPYRIGIPVVCYAPSGLRS